MFCIILSLTQLCRKTRKEIQMKFISHGGRSPLTLYGCKNYNMQASKMIINFYYIRRCKQEAEYRTRREDFDIFSLNQRIRDELHHVERMRDDRSPITCYLTNQWGMCLQENRGKESMNLLIEAGDIIT